MEVVFSEASLLERARGGSRLKTSQVKKVSLKYIFVKNSRIKEMKNRKLRINEQNYIVKRKFKK